MIAHMKRLIPAGFVIVAAILAIVYFSTRTIGKTKDTSSSTVATSPDAITATVTSAQDVLGTEENSLISFMPLRSNETLLSSMGIALDQDTLDDEILIIRKSGNPNLFVLIGIYNPQTTEYDRVAEIDTTVTQLKSFSYNGLDMTGDHRTSLVFQGITETGETVMKIYFCSTSGGSFRLINIGDFKADGTIFISQHDRDSSYELSQSSGRSFPVWVYSSDTREGQGSLSQLQTQYDWNASVGRYVQVQQIYVPGRNIAAKELAKIQDGTVETFAGYLNGLWYKISDSNEKELRYVFFDYDNKEVIFLVGDAQEVYTWGNSNLYKNGIYLSIANSFIPNLRRRVDITLTDVDEVRIFTHDDVRMRIGAENLWDGQYKKMNPERSGLNFEEIDSSIAEDFKSQLEDTITWQTSDGTNVVFKDNQYSISNETTTETGSYVVTQIGKNCVIQFKPNINTANNNTNSELKADTNPVSYFGTTYKLKYNQIVVPPPANSRNRKSTLKDDKTTIIMQPSAIMSSDAFDIPGQVLTLKQDVSE